jgi:hypothetical protein
LASVPAISRASASTSSDKAGSEETGRLNPWRSAFRAARAGPRAVFRTSAGPLVDRFPLVLGILVRQPLRIFGLVFRKVLLKNFGKTVCKLFRIQFVVIIELFIHVFEDRQPRTRAQPGRYGTDVAKWESRFFSVCDVNGLGVAKTSPATTAALEMTTTFGPRRPNQCD